MSADSWFEDNSRYLSLSLEWLRLRLSLLALERSDSPEAPAAPKRGWLRRALHWLAGLFGLGSEQAPAGGSRLRINKVRKQLERAAEARQAAADARPEPALVALAERTGLSTFEQDTLLLCAAMELDPDWGSLCARAQGDPRRRYPTFGLALTAFEDSSWDALSTHRPLRFARLIEVGQTGTSALTTSPLRADERIVNFIKGLNVLDDRLETLLTEVASEPLVSDSQRTVVESIQRRLRRAAEQSILPAVQLVGDDKGSKMAVAAAVCQTLNRRPYRIGVEALPTDVAEIEALLRLWQRESMLLPIALYLDADNLDAASSAVSAAFQRLLSRQAGLLFVGVRGSPVRVNAESFAVDVEKPTAAEQYQGWLAALGGGRAGSNVREMAQMLAGHFNLGLVEIREASSLAAEAKTDDELLIDRIWQTCRDMTRPHLDALAQRLEPKATWDDLVLAEEPARLLRLIAGQVRNRHKVYDDWGFALRMNRGFGISALFAGESGTGKTMAAEVIANELGLNLYRIDLSAVVSKYIGETEKNLRKLFDAAEKGGSILLFDEADALFGKRSEVKDSHDRYANIEINYLLQRMEAFSGLAILATNMKSALDKAFLRRLRFIVNFQFPGVTERLHIWQRALPPQTPTGELDFERLARLNMTGGNIHSVALSAAFQAASNGELVTMPILLTAAMLEMRKLDKPFNEAEFR